MVAQAGMYHLLAQTETMKLYNCRHAKSVPQTLLSYVAAAKFLSRDACAQDRHQQIYGYAVVDQRCGVRLLINTALT